MYDVIIIGSGISSLIASVFIKKKFPKFSILVLEWGDKIGGNSKMATSGISLVNIVSKEVKDTPSKFLNDVKDVNHVTRFIANNSTYILEVLTSFGINFNIVNQTGMHSVPRTFNISDIDTNIGSYMVNKLYNLSKSMGIEFKLNACVHSVRESGILTFKDSQHIFPVFEIQLMSGQILNTIRLIIATGGYGANKKMIPSEYRNLPTSNCKYAIGSGIMFAKQLGGVFVDSNVQIHPTSFVTPYVVKGQKIPEKTWLVPEVYRTIGSVLYGIAGDPLSPRNKLSSKILQSSNGIVKMKIPSTADSLNSTKVYKENGLILSNPDAAMDGYKYIAYIKPCVHYTTGGILVDEYNRVLKSDKTIVPNVYAVGEAAHIFNGERACGLGLATAFVTGIIVGNTIV